ncbi:hypothetical protein PM082_017312 [Marasmius tenuissimus]|nr:hypothetical protein PM082_017312 [Marasmius tenuissimus]
MILSRAILPFLSSELPSSYPHSCPRYRSRPGFANTLLTALGVIFAKMATRAKWVSNQRRDDGMKQSGCQRARSAFFGGFFLLRDGT